MAFWKPGSSGGPGSAADRHVSGGDDTLVALPLPGVTAQLPIADAKSQILWALEHHQVLILHGPTGSGKTTQVPQFLLDAGWTAADQGFRGTRKRLIAITQPRRLAATTLAARVAEERGSVLGEEIGYSVRFEDASHPRLTKVKFLTDGLLFQEAMADPLLSQYSVIMVDEAHERSLYTDILLGVLKKILKKRPELRLIISSATLDVEAFKDFYSNNNANGHSSDANVAIVPIQGRAFPVDIHYLQEPCPDYVSKAAETVLRIHFQEGPGDILVFLTGKEEIERAGSLISDRLSELASRSSTELIVLPLHGGLPLAEQMRALENPVPGIRKCILSTNVAEASVTIDGIAFVVDSGFVKVKAYNPSTSMESLVVTPTSQASATQRAGRAGRTRSGKAYRLYTQEAHSKSMPRNSIPEMQRSNLATVILQLKAIGIENVLYFDFLSPPPAKMMTRALELLYSLNALDDYARLTMPFGMHLAEFPLDPLLGTCLLNSEKFGCSEEMASIAAMLSVQSVFLTPHGKIREAEEERTKFAVEEGDHITYLNVYQAFIKNNKSQTWCHRYFLNYKSLLRAVTIRAQLVKHLAKVGVEMKTCGIDTASLRKCLVSGYFSEAAKMMPDGSFLTVRDKLPLHMHPNSVLFRRAPQYVIYHEVVETTKPFMRDVTVIEARWLTDLAPHFYELKPGR